MLKELQTRRTDVQVVGIAVDKRDAVVGFAANMQFNYPILIGESGGWDAAAAFGVNVYALPFTVFTAPNGAVLGVHTGELHPEHLDNFTAVLDDLRAGKIDVATARATDCWPHLAAKIGETGRQLRRKHVNSPAIVTASRCGWRDSFC